MRRAKWEPLVPSMLIGLAFYSTAFPEVGQTWIRRSAGFDLVVLGNVVALSDTSRPSPDGGSKVELTMEGGYHALAYCVIFSHSLPTLTG